MLAAEHTRSGLDVAGWEEVGGGWGHGQSAEVSHENLLSLWRLLCSTFSLDNQWNHPLHAEWSNQRLDDTSGIQVYFIFYQQKKKSILSFCCKCLRCHALMLLLVLSAPPWLLHPGYTTEIFAHHWQISLCNHIRMEGHLVVSVSCCCNKKILSWAAWLNCFFV